VPPGATIGLVSQTTREWRAFQAFEAQLVAAFGRARVVAADTVCGVTERQKASTRDVAAQVDLVVVVGGRASANTRHLVEVCREEGAYPVHVETVAELRPEWFAGVTRVGLTAGASTPDVVLDDVRRWLAAHQPGRTSPDSRTEALTRLAGAGA
jgi:4-hydroxy-3-methylbut-2-enyl diphosphate reductase